MSRKYIAALSFLLALPQPSWAQNAGPLPPGKPAGIRQAQMRFDGAIFFGAVIAIAAVGFLVSTRPYVVPNQPSNSASSTSG